jgi:hypothetical protein
MDITSVKILFKRYSISIGIIIILIGLTLRISTLFYTGIIFSILGEIGTFLAVSVAMAFIYDLFLKETDEKIFLEELSKVLEERFHSLSNEDQYPIFYHERRKIEQKIKFYEKASSEIIEVGAKLHTLSNYFQSIAPNDFEDHIITLLKQGVKIKLLLLDPKSEYAIEYAKCLKENSGEEDFIKNIEDSILNFKKLKKRLIKMNLPNTFEVYQYSAIPCFNAVLIDKESVNGYVFISPYIFNTRGNSTPGFEFSRRNYPEVFNQYQKSIESLLLGSEKIV